MSKKVILISIDGMRPDGMQKCGNPFVKELEKLCSYTYVGSSMHPSVTFPCHFSMSHGVTPQRHGLLTNTYVPQVRPVKGIFEKVNEAHKVGAMFYGWEPLRDISSPGSLKYAEYVNAYMEDSSDTVLTDRCIERINKSKPDFVFLYMVETDEKGGHDNGWMSDEYLRIINVAISNVKRIFDLFKDEYSIIIMADHGGHERSHGTDMKEDMTIPLFFYGDDIEKGKDLGEGYSLLNIAPTIVKIMGLEPEPEWEEKAIY